MMDIFLPELCYHNVSEFYHLKPSMYIIKFIHPLTITKYNVTDS